MNDLHFLLFSEINIVRMSVKTDLSPVSVVAALRQSRKGEFCNFLVVTRRLIKLPLQAGPIQYSW